MVPSLNSLGNYCCKRIPPRVNSDPSFLDVPKHRLLAIFEYLVDLLHLAIRHRVIGLTMDQASPEGCVQLLPKVSDKL
jgi:hypothetical protein